MNETAIKDVTANFDKSEIIEIFEIARLALYDDNFIEAVGEESDLSEDYLVSLREKIEKAME